MVKKQKLLRIAKRNPQGLQFSEFENLLSLCSWTFRRQTPSRKEYSGQFNVRIDKRIHRGLVLEATKAGISLNALVAQKLARDYTI